MGNVLISLDEKHELMLRRLAKDHYSGKKGSLRTIIEEGIDEVARKDKRRLAVEKMLAHMRKGMSLGLGKRKAYESRDEIYD